MFVRTRAFICLFMYLLNRQQKKEKRLLTLPFFTCYLSQNNFANVWLKIL